MLVLRVYRTAFLLLSITAIGAARSLSDKPNQRASPVPDGVHHPKDKITPREADEPIETSVNLNLRSKDQAVLYPPMGTARGGYAAHHRHLSWNPRYNYHQHPHTQEECSPITGVGSSSKKEINVNPQKTSPSLRQSHVSSTQTSLSSIALVDYFGPGIAISGEIDARTVYTPEIRSQEWHYDKLRIETTSAPVTSSAEKIGKVDAALFVGYFCNAFSTSLPIMLMPFVAAEHATLASPHNHLPLAAFATTVASIATLGGGVGKIFNGIICQTLGGRASSCMYLMGSALSLFLLTSKTILAPMSASRVGGLLATLDFFSSIQWTAMSLVLSNHYERTPAKFARGITILSVASTSGTLLAKMGGMILLQLVNNNWRAVAQIGAGLALFGAVIVGCLVSDTPSSTTKNIQQNKREISAYSGQQKGSNNNAIQAFKSVLSSPLFWLAGFAHATVFLARTSDRILGAFFQDATALPRHICGGLSASVTFGFIYGLFRGRIFHDLEDIKSKTRMLATGYKKSVLAALALAICANPWFRNDIVSKFAISSPILNLSPAMIMSCLLFWLSAYLASSVSFQFYQLPPMISTVCFSQNKAVCLSLLDGMGFFVSATVWAIISGIVQNVGPRYGWSMSWMLLATLFGIGGTIMTRIIPSVLLQQKKQQQANLVI